MLLFGRALARDCVSSALAPFVDSVRPCPESPVLRFLHASVCPPSPFSSGSREGADHSSPRGELDAKWMRNGCELDANWMHGRLDHLHVFMPKQPPRTEQPSMADFALPCGEARKLLGNCADGRLGAFCLSSLQSLEFRRAIFPSPSLRGAWRGASRWRQSGGGGDR
jgi:hypothetical protein